MDTEQALRNYLSAFLYEQGLRCRDLLLSTVLSTLKAQGQRWLDAQQQDVNLITVEQITLAALYAMCDVGMQVN